MAGHILITALICTMTCAATDVRVWDGDSIRLGRSSKAESIRIMNIDAPEIDGRCRFETDLAQNAKRALSGLLDGKQIMIYRTGRDKYGRTLATLSVNGQDVGDLMVAHGYARTWSGRREPWC